MEWVTIHEASRRLNVSQDIIRKYVREGKLNGRREQNASLGKAWIVQLPEDGWEDEFKHHIHGIASAVTPWWRPDDSCLLYTSPSPRDATLSRMPSSA